MRKRLTINSLLSLCLIAPLLSACGRSRGGDGGGDNPPPVVVYTYELNSTNISLKYYSSYQLEIITNNKNSFDVTWSSLDESIASVSNNGLVTSYGVIGSTRITATFLEEVLECEVYVSQSDVYPVLSIVEPNLLVGKNDTYVLSPKVTWDDEDITSSCVIECEKIISPYVSVESSENKFSIRGIEVGETTLRFYSVVRGHLVVEDLGVRVVNNNIIVEPLNYSSFKYSENGFSVDIYNTSISGYSDDIALDFDVYVDNRLTSTSINWTMLSGNQFVRIEGNHLKGIAPGKALIQGHIISGTSEANIYLDVSCMLPRITLSQSVDVEVQRNAPISLSQYDISSGTGDVLLNNNKIGVISNKSMTLYSASLPKSAKELGSNELVLSFSDIEYLLPVNLYSLIIRNAEDFDNMLVYAKQNDPLAQYADGYFVLGNDIEYNKEIYPMFCEKDLSSISAVSGEWYNGKKAGFKGIFDGLGYSIRGLTSVALSDSNNVYSGGIFGVLATGSIIRNVAFYNASVNAETAFIATAGDGEINNVYVEYRSIGNNPNNKWSTNVNSLTKRNYCGTYYTSGIEGAVGENAKVINCVIDASNAVVNEKYVADHDTGVYIPSTNIVSNVNQSLRQNTLCLYPKYYTTSCISSPYAFKSYSEAISDTSCKQFIDNLSAEYWTISNNYIWFKSMKNKLSQTTIKISSSKTTLYADESTELFVNYPGALCIFTVSDLSLGYIEQGIFYTSSDISVSKTVIVTVKSVLNSSNQATINIQVYA